MQLAAIKPKICEPEPNSGCQRQGDGMGFYGFMLREENGSLGGNVGHRSRSPCPHNHNPISYKREAPYLISKCTPRGNEISFARISSHFPQLIEITALLYVSLLHSGAI